MRHWSEKGKLDGNNWQWTRWSAWRGRRCQGSQKRRERLLGRAICQCQFTLSTNYCCGGSAVIKHPANPQIVSQAKKSIKVGVITTLTRWSIKAHRRAFEYHFIFSGKNFALSFYNLLPLTNRFSFPKRIWHAIINIASLLWCFAENWLWLNKYWFIFVIFWFQNWIVLHWCLHFLTIYGLRHCNVFHQ